MPITYQTPTVGEGHAEIEALVAKYNIARFTIVDDGGYFEVLPVRTDGKTLRGLPMGRFEVSAHHGRAAAQYAAILVMNGLNSIVGVV